MPKPSHTLRSHVDGDGAVILHIENGTMTRLNATGALAWTALEQGCSVDEIVQRVCKETQVDEEVATADVKSFLVELRSAGLLSC